MKITKSGNRNDYVLRKSPKTANVMITFYENRKSDERNHYVLKIEKALA